MYNHEEKDHLCILNNISGYSLLLYLLMLNHQITKKKNPQNIHKYPKMSNVAPINFLWWSKVIPPTVADEKADADKQERKEKKESEWWLVKLTAALALIGAISGYCFSFASTPPPPIRRGYKRSCQSC